MVIMVSKLRSYREELKPKVTQERMARIVDVTLQTYRNAEGGGRVTYGTATSILKGLNLARSERGLPPLVLEDLDISIM